MFEVAKGNVGSCISDLFHLTSESHGMRTRQATNENSCLISDLLMKTIYTSLGAYGFESLYSIKLMFYSTNYSLYNCK